jgi:hypothetical protein
MHVNEHVQHRLFTKLVMQPTGCITWTGGRAATNKNTRAGYGQISIAGSKVYIHRLMYELFVGPIPADYEVDHTCFNTLCGSPDHLEAVTAEENHRRWAATITHCKFGHLFTAENTYDRGQRGRRCRRCHLDDMRRRYHSKKAA